MGSTVRSTRYTVETPFSWVSESPRGPGVTPVVTSSYWSIVSGGSFPDESEDRRVWEVLTFPATVPFSPHDDVDSLETQ